MIKKEALLKYTPEEIRDALAVKRVLPWAKVIVRTSRGSYARGGPDGGTVHHLPGYMFQTLEKDTERLLLGDIVEDAFEDVDIMHSIIYALEEYRSLHKGKNPAKMLISERAYIEMFPDGVASIGHPGTFLGVPFEITAESGLHIQLCEPESRL